MAGLIQSDPLWRELDQAFRTIKGVADRTVARLMAEMPEIGTLSNKTISKLAGLAPLANDSGKHQGRRAVRGGRSAVRDILFIVGSVVARYEPDFIVFQQRLRAAGKPPKVVRIAVAHKLLVRLKHKGLRGTAICMHLEPLVYPTVRKNSRPSIGGKWEMPLAFPQWTTSTSFPRPNYIPDFIFRTSRSAERPPD